MEQVITTWQHHDGIIRVIVHNNALNRLLFSSDVVAGKQGEGLPAPDEKRRTVGLSASEIKMCREFLVRELEY